MVTTADLRVITEALRDEGFQDGKGITLKFRGEEFFIQRSGMFYDVQHDDAFQGALSIGEVALIILATIRDIELANLEARMDEIEVIQRSV